jgi:release factor glutamine methyltransferase
VTVLEVIQRSSEFLARKEVDSPRLQVELILAKVLSMPRMKLYLSFEQRLTDQELDSVRVLVKRRGDREPLQHLLGSTSFCGYEIAVTRDVLIPRPETELLVEEAVGFLERSGIEVPQVFDFGTGSGCVAIVIAAKQASAQVTALDVSAAALEVARSNAMSHQVAERIEFINGDGSMALPEDRRFDLIVSNPPYVPTAEIPTLQPEVREHDPKTALDGGPDGLDFYRQLAVEMVDRLRSGGKLMLELGAGQGADVSGLLQAQGWIVEVLKKDYNGFERILVARRGD